MLTFSLSDVEHLAKVFGNVIEQQGYTCYACAIMPDHVHMLIRRHRDKAETMIDNFRDASRTALYEAKIRHAPHPVWTAGRGWVTFISSKQQFINEIEYIRRNPLKIKWPEQRWSFVKPYDGWMPGYRG